MKIVVILQMHSRSVHDYNCQPAGEINAFVRECSLPADERRARDLWRPRARRSAGLRT